MKIHVLSFALLAACVGLAACQEGATDAPSAGTPASDGGAPATESATPLADAFDAQDEVARALDASGLDAIDAPLHCSVDSINETPASDAVALSRSGRARFSGFIQAASLDDPSILVLRSADGAYFVNNAPTMERADIAEYKGIEGSSAFDYSTFATLDAVQPGSYTIELLARDGDAIRRCASSVVVAVE